jgi:lipopolysaccharide/colanic/teichoic acid biosynthesis glycosyltransferase
MALSRFIRRIEKTERHRLGHEVRLRQRTSIAADRELYEELDFLHLLYLERRRSERSSRPLCLVLVEQTGIADAATRATALRHICDRLRGSIRETDTVGWYYQNSTLAIMFSDLNTADPTVVNALGTRVSTAVSLALSPEIAQASKISVHLFPKNSGVDSNIRDLTFYPEVSAQYDARRTELALKRIIDIGGSFFLLCLLGPLFLLIAAAIRLDSKGPIIYRQARVGQHGETFSFLKFRSMYVDSDAAIHREYVTTFISRGDPTIKADEIFKITNDPRVTTVGGLLRKASLDELPQLWNVLCGDMSLVGPRPPIPYECDCYAPWHRRRIMEVKPGITGLWQVMGRSRLSFNDMVRLDLKYARQWSIWLDIKILLRTPKAVLTGEGAY